METTHKGRKITFNENNEKWTADTVAGEFECETLAAAKARIDKTAKGDFKRIPAIYSGSRHGDDAYSKVVITSFVASNYGSTYAWITEKSKRGGTSRQKVSLNSLYTDTPANHALIVQINDVRKETAALNKTEAALCAKMENVRFEAGE